MLSKGREFSGTAHIGAARRGLARDAAGGVLRAATKAAAVVALLALTALVLWQSHALALRHSMSEAALRAETALRLTVNALEAELAHYQVVPQLLADLDDVRQLVGQPDDPSLREQMDGFLAGRNAVLRSSDIYIMRADGLTIAASNHGGPRSFVGQNFSYRPYFREAMEGRTARFFGVGTTSGVRGYFFSAPVRDPEGRIAGVIAVKIGVSQTEASWQGSEFRIMVTDPLGIAFMSSVPDWLYGGIEPLSDGRLSDSARIRRYADVPVHDLAVHDLAANNLAAGNVAGTRLLRIPTTGTLAGADYIAASQHMPHAGWTVHVLSDARGPRTEATVLTLAVLLVLCAVALGTAVLMQRRARISERIRLAADAKADLEQRVGERTADLARVNAHLEQEITERRATEAELRAAQASLVRVGKLAALGQMSAALSHEVNQPLAAARNYADSAAILIDRGDTVRARENIRNILVLIDRMATIGRHLRHAARKPKDRLTPVALPALLVETQMIVSSRLATAGAVLDLDLAPDLPPVMAGATRLQQVLVNLITNAADAAEGQPDPRIQLRAARDGTWVVITVRDFGAGIAPAIAERIFDPFFTTKGLGAGLGLGLSITYNIVRDFGGEIRAGNAGPGAVFTVRLPAALSDGVAADPADATTDGAAA